MGKPGEGGEQVSVFALTFHPATFQERNFSLGRHVPDNPQGKCNPLKSRLVSAAADFFPPPRLEGPRSSALRGSLIGYFFAAGQFVGFLHQAVWGREKADESAAKDKREKLQLAQESSKKWEKGQTLKKTHWWKYSPVWQMSVKAWYCGQFVWWGCGPPWKGFSRPLEPSLASFLV